LDTPSFAPATGYISFFTLILYVGGLILLAFAGNEIDRVVYPMVEDSRQLRAPGRLELHDAILDDQTEPVARVDRQPASRDE
jgi:hypothetical protein